MIRPMKFDHLIDGQAQTITMTLVPGVTLRMFRASPLVAVGCAALIRKPIDLLLHAGCCLVVG